MEPSQDIIRRHLNLRHVIVDFLYTILISALIAVFLTVSGLSDSFFSALIISQSFGISIYSIINFLLWLFKPERIFSVIFILIVGVAGGIMIGLHLGSFILREFFPTVPKESPRDFLQTLIFAITFGGVISYFFLSKARLKVTREEVQQERIQRLSKEKEALEANLRLLQAQIEPHFLFNTLSNVLSLIDTDSAKGKSMLIDLMHYLRISLSWIRHDFITMDQELEFIRSYLNIFKIRMGERLIFKIELPDALKEHPFPPMLIQPLVENAVKHGLEPQIEGGVILIKAQEADDQIRIEIADSGVGLPPYSEAGMGMENVRERLKLLYGDKGRLILEENKPNGVRAIIEMPREWGYQK